MADDTIRVDVVINAHAAIGQLQQIAKSSQYVEEAVARLGDFFTRFSQKTKTPLAEVQKLFQDINQELVASGGESIFGGYEEDIVGLTTQYNKLRQAAGTFKVDNNGVVTSLAAVEDRALAVSKAVEQLYNPRQQRDARGRFTGAMLPDFKSQLGSLTDYNARLNLVQNTISGIAKTTGASFKEVGAALQKAFPELQNTNLVSTALDNLNKRAMGLAGTFRSLKQVAAEVDLALAKLSASGKLSLGGVGKQNIEAVANALRTVKATTGASFDQVAAGLKRMGVDSAVVTQALRQVNKELGQIPEARHGIDVVRTALGTLVAVGIFQVIQAVQMMVAGMVKGLKEIEAATFNIINAEKKLSEQGIEISVQGLDKLIDDLQKLDPMLSRFQATELVSTLATKVAPAFGFGTAEIERMAKSITILAVRNQALGKSFEEVEQQVITGLLSGKVTQGINQLGLKITDQIVKEEAVALGLVQSAKAYDELNAKAQERINILTIISILEKDTAEEAKSLPTFLQTVSGMIGVAKAEFQDILTTLGQKFAPVFKEILRGVIEFLERLNRSLEQDLDAWNTFVTILTVVARAAVGLINTFEKLALVIGKAGSALYSFLRGIPLVGAAVEKLFPKNPYPDTPTGIAAPDETEAAQAQERANEAISKAQDKLEDITRDHKDKLMDIERDYQDKLADINSDYANKVSDINRDAGRKREDALRNYHQKVEDINRDTNQKIADAQQDARDKELDREAEFQNKLRELREEFLFDLEDALHERDARQVLRLIRQYNLDKKNLEERHKLERVNAKKDLAEKIADLERERQIKLEAAKRELAEKQAEIDLWQQRELADARLHMQRQLADARQWYQRQLEQQREYLQRKLRDLAAAIAQEYNMTQAGAQAIYSMLNSYMGTGMKLPSTSTSTSSSSGGSSGITRTIGGQQYVQPYPGAPYMTLANPQYAAAEGGNFVVTRPTTILAGEAGPEMVSVNPLNKIGADVGKFFGDVGGLGGSQGSLSLRIALQEGLVAEIIDTSLEAVSTHIDTVRREK